MLKLPIKYHIFDGSEVTEDFYFQLMESEVIEFNTEFPGGLEAYVDKISKTTDQGSLIKLFKKLILMAYGERSEDGRGFAKSEEKAIAFSQTEAYSNLFMDLATDDEKAADFIKGIMPKTRTQKVSSVVDIAELKAAKNKTTK